MKMLQKSTALFLALLMLLIQIPPVFASAASREDKFSGKIKFEDIALNFDNRYYSTFRDYAPLGDGTSKARNPFPRDMYYLVFGENAAARAYFDKADADNWSGSCYGISLLAMLLYMSEHSEKSSFPKLSRFSPTPENMLDLKVGSTVKVEIGGEKKQVTAQYLIELLHISQRDLAIQSEKDNNKNRYDQLVSALSAANKDGIYPILIGIDFDDGVKETGHALVGYDYKDVGDTTLLKVYDSNCPTDDSRVVTLEKDKNGNYTSWSYTMADGTKWGSNQGKDSNISFLNYTTIYNSWCLISGNGFINPPDDKLLLTEGYSFPGMDIPTQDLSFEIETYWREPFEGIVEGREEHRKKNNGSYQMIELADGIEASIDYTAIKNGVPLWVDVGAYRIVNNVKFSDKFKKAFFNAYQTEFDENDPPEWTKYWMVTVVQKDQSITVKTNANAVYVYLNDKDMAACVEIAEPNKSYEIDLRSSLKTDFEDVPYKGTTPDNVSEASPFSVLRYKGGRESDYYELESAGVYKVDGAHKQLLKIITPPIETRPDPNPETDNLNPNSGSPFYEHIVWGLSRALTDEFGYYRGIIAGYRDVKVENGIRYVEFRPNNLCAQGALLRMLWRLKGCPDEGGVCPFPNVDKNDEDLCKAVVWAYKNGIVTEVDPSKPCTRAEVVCYLWRMEGLPSAKNSKLSDFTDLDGQDEDYLKAIDWALENGITNGTTPSTFNPDAPCTRAHVVKFLHTMCNLNNA